MLGSDNPPPQLAKKKTASGSPLDAGADRSALLASLPLFQGLADAVLWRIALGAREQRLTKGEILFHRGDECSGFHLIVSGQVKLAFTSPEGGEKVVEVLGRGQTFGEAVMFMERPYIVTAQAVRDSVVVQVAKQVIFEEIERDPKFARKMIGGLAMRLHHLMQDLESYSLRSGRQRVVAYLLRMVSERDERTVETGRAEGLSLRLPFAKGTIASRLNLTSEHFSRMLAELTQAGLLIVRGRIIQIPDLERLRHYVG